MIIYKITYKPKLTKRYIGKNTKYDSNEELQKSDYWGSGKYIKRAIKKYGKDNFEREVLVQGIETKETLDLWEKVLIWGFGSIYPNGYNLTNGGEGGDTFTDNPDKEKIKEKIRETLIKKGTLKGNKNPNFGKDFSGKNGPNWGKEGYWRGKKGYWAGRKNPEQSKKMTGDKNPAAREVILISPPPGSKSHHLFYYQDFCLEYNLNPTSICRVLKGKQDNHKGWTGKYLDNPKPKKDK